MYKFLYANRLLDCGLSSQAFHYCEVVGQAILRHQEPFFVLTGEVVKVNLQVVLHIWLTISDLFNYDTMVILYVCFSCSCQTDWDTQRVSSVKQGSIETGKNLIGWSTYVLGTTVYRWSGSSVFSHHTMFTCVWEEMSPLSLLYKEELNRGGNVWYMRVSNLAWHQFSTVSNHNCSQVTCDFIVHIFPSSHLEQEWYEVPNQNGKWGIFFQISVVLFAHISYCCVPVI